MSTCASPSCEYPTGQDTFICKNCLQALRRDLGDIPALIDDLHTTLSRQDAVGASSGRRASESSLPWKESASEALWVLASTVTAWVREFQDPDAAPFPDAPIAAARWLLTNVHHVASRPEAGKVVDEIGSAVAQAYDAIDRPPDMLIAGQCGNNGCEEYLYARPDSKTMKCRLCETEHQVTERRAWMVNYAAEMQLPAFMCLKWVRLLMGKEIPRGTWDAWVYKSGRVEAVARDHVGNPLYRFGDVRDLAADWVARPRKGQAA